MQNFQSTSSSVFKRGGDIRISDHHHIKKESAVFILVNNAEKADYSKAFHKLYDQGFGNNHMLGSHFKDTNNEIFVAEGYATQSDIYNYVISKQNTPTYYFTAPHRLQKYTVFKVPVSVLTIFIHLETF